MNLATLIKPKNNLLKKQIFSKIFKDLFDEIVEFDEKKTLKDDMEFLNLICNLIEFLVEKHRKNLLSFRIDKKKMICDVFETVYSITPEERIQLERHIQFIFENGMISTVSNYRIFKKSFSAYLKKSFSLS